MTEAEINVLLTRLKEVVGAEAVAVTFMRLPDGSSRTCLVAAVEDMDALMASMEKGLEISRQKVAAVKPKVAKVAAALKGLKIKTGPEGPGGN